MIKIDKNVVTFSSADGTMHMVIQMDYIDISHLDEKLKAKGTHFIEGYNARVMVRTAGGTLVIVPQ